MNMNDAKYEPRTLDSIFMIKLLKLDLPFFSVKRTRLPKLYALFDNYYTSIQRHRLDEKKPYPS
jgi:hypothetical protein